MATLIWFHKFPIGFLIATHNQSIIQIITVHLPPPNYLFRIHRVSSNFHRPFLNNSFQYVWYLGFFLSHSPTPELNLYHSRIWLIRFFTKELLLKMLNGLPKGTCHLNLCTFGFFQLWSKQIYVGNDFFFFYRQQHISHTSVT